MIIPALLFVYSLIRTLLIGLHADWDRWLFGPMEGPEVIETPDGVRQWYRANHGSDDDGEPRGFSVCELREKCARESARCTCVMFESPRGNM